MSNPIAQLAAKIAGVERQVKSLASAPQLAYASVDVDGEYVEVTDGVRTAFTADSKATEAQVAIAATQAELDQASADLAQAQLDVAQTQADVAQAQADLTTAQADIDAAAAAAAAADSKAVAAQSAATAASTAASTAQAQADKGVSDANAAALAASAAQTAASTADGKAVAAQGTATTAKATADAVAARGSNLVVNGNGALGDATNFATHFTFNGADAPTGSAGSFVDKSTAQHGAYADGAMPWTPGKSYRFEWQIRQTVPGALNKCYGFIYPQDGAGLGIDPQHYMYVAGTTTTLAADLKPGDTTIKLTSAANWYGTAAKPAGASNSHLRGIIVWNYVDKFGKAWPVGSYSRNAWLTLWADGGIDAATNTITLSTPWPASRGTIPAGTSLSNSTSGGSFIYQPSATNVDVPETWTSFGDTLSVGVMPRANQAVASTGSANWTSGLPEPTAQVKIGWLLNYPTGGGRMAVANVSLSDVNAAQATASAVDTLTSGWKKIGSVLMDGGKIFADSIGAGQIAADAILARHLKAGEITAGKLVAGTLTSASGVFGDISAASITSGYLAAARIAAGTIVADHLAAGSVLAEKLAAGSVIAEKLGAGSVVADKLAAGAVLADKIAARAVNASHLYVGDLSNLAEISESVPGSVVYGSWTSSVVNGWASRSGTRDNYMMFRNRKGPIPLKTGDKVRITFDAYASAAVTAGVSLWTYDAAFANGPAQGLITTVALTTTPQTFTGVGTVTIDPSGMTHYIIGMSAAAFATTDVFVRNVRVHRMNAGELVVDGSIKATSLAADAIDGKTITGSTLRTSATGERIEVVGGTTTTDNEIRLYIGDETLGYAKLRTTGTGGGRSTGLLGQTIPGSPAYRSEVVLQSGVASLQTRIGTASDVDAGLGSVVSKVTTDLQKVAVTGASSIDLNATSVFVNGTNGLRCNDGPITGDAGIQSTPMRPVEFRWTDNTVITYGSTAAATWTGRTGAGTFVAPPSGSVTIAWGGQSKSGAAGQYAAIGIEVKTGATIGSGTVVKAYDVNQAWLNYGTDYQVGMLTTIVDGLTPGATYNTRTLIASGTTTPGSFLRGRIVVTPNL